MTKHHFEGLELYQLPNEANGKINRLAAMQHSSVMVWATNSMENVLIKYRKGEHDKQEAEAQEKRINLLREAHFFMNEVFEAHQRRVQYNVDMQFVNIKLMGEKEELKKEIEKLKRQIANPL